ncbi:energy transducer TonB [Congregibacter litoralis]|uniref:TonB family C-terminal domain protein n=1 Tax=Congregibacter litoralis KT71 TaxID=314285 RepID=A4A9E1_9GAMM|nr:TonB family protein [Congregibacter litoralis]EAQ97683.1 TonB family C-terminal domain protein [Congregibacter litoralis KT71]
MTTAVADGNDRLMLAVLIASTLHVLLIFGVSFDVWRGQKARHQVEVTLVQTPGRRPVTADHIAQADQTGSGSEALRDRASGAKSALPQPIAQSAQRQTTANAGRERLAAPAVTSTNGERKVVDRRGEQQNLEDLPEAERELARLQQKLAQLQADLNVQRQQYSNQPRVRRLTAVSASAAVDAAYLADWRSRVESVGNQYYPEASLRYGIYGSLEMLVTVRKDGSLEDIDILRSSGYAVLDEAAMRIVRLAAPYSPFPDELRATTDKLEIVRIWQFEQNPLSSN